MSQKFQVIVADPPWSFNDALRHSDVKRGAEDNYSVMNIEDIKNLPIKDVADLNGSILALWVPSSLLQEGLDTMKAWGFNQKQSYVWVKTKKERLSDFKKWIIDKILNHKQIQYDKFAYERAVESIIESLNNVDLYDELSFGMGRLFRNCHEICLIGTNNNGIYKLLQNKSQRTVSFGENIKHSAKPEHLQDSLELMFPGSEEKQVNKIELFARRKRTGWVCLGNEIGDKKDIRVSLKELI